MDTNEHESVGQGFVLTEGKKGAVRQGGGGLSFLPEYPCRAKSVVFICGLIELPGG
jgi:hypothetical protein